MGTAGALGWCLGPVRGLADGTSPHDLRRAPPGARPGGRRTSQSRARSSEQSDSEGAF